ncbi:polyprenyl diphosphate synthase [Neochlamydia sp. AcF84]|uniref:polyprenyl diphosphate synthase n=1 Tax=Neochlamydia sp. AcF84 TaxID=2315858 RepID=UPI001408AE75|nr:polyprenyl diphosphate synthase [Neochlamydia sp. AcF84]
MNIFVKNNYYTLEQKASLDPKRIPQHVAFIPDGNRRWAKRQQMRSIEGHQEGSDNLIEIVKAGKELGIKNFTFYLFSTENWSRPQEEIDALMWLLHTYLIEQQSFFVEEGTRLCTIGNTAALPEYVQKTIEETRQVTAHCQEADLIFALNYGSRDEIKRAVQSIAQDIIHKKITPEQISEEIISQYLDTAPWSDPDLLIRTSGELRLSNYLLWQLSYTEIFSSNVLWPDFTPYHLLEALLNYQKRERRLGGA